MSGGVLNDLSEKIKNYYPILIIYITLASLLLTLGIKNSKRWYKVLNIISLVINLVIIVGLLLLYNIFITRFFINPI